MTRWSASPCRARACSVVSYTNPARSAYRSVTATFSVGAGILHRMLWKYQAWLQGFNGGPLRQPTMKLRDVHMR